MSSANISDGDGYPRNPTLGSELQGQLPGCRNVGWAFVAKLELTAAEAAAAASAAVHAAVTDTGVEQVVTTGLTDPPYSRNVTATAGGTAGDIAAVAVTVEGRNEAGQFITETLPAFTVNTAGTVQGNKAFKSVSKVTIPAHDGLGATTAVGFGDKVGLSHYLDGNAVLFATLNGVREGTAPTVVADADELEKNTADLNSALNGTPVNIYYLVG